MQISRIGPLTPLRQWNAHPSKFPRICILQPNGPRALRIFKLIITCRWTTWISIFAATITVPPSPCLKLVLIEWSIMHCIELDLKFWLKSYLRDNHANQGYLPNWKRTVVRVHLKLIKMGFATITYTSTTLLPACTCWRWESKAVGT